MQTKEQRRQKANEYRRKNYKIISNVKTDVYNALRYIAKAKQINFTAFMDGVFNDVIDDFERENRREIYGKIDGNFEEILEEGEEENGKENLPCPPSPAPITQARPRGQDVIDPNLPTPTKSPTDTVSQLPQHKRTAAQITTVKW